MSSTMWQGCEQEYASSVNPIDLYNSLRVKDVYVFEPDDNIPRANLINGGICYIHSKLFEVSTPECRTSEQVVAFDKAAEAYARLASWSLEEQTGRKSHLYKTSIALDPKGEQPYTTVGSHENYLVHRKDYMENLSLLVPFLISRQIFCGSGGFVDGAYLISPRTLFPKTVFSSVSTDYPIVSTRDESHASEAYSRAHIVNGEGARSEYTTFLKFGVTSSVLKAIELGLIKDVPEIDDPISANRRISAELAGEWDVSLKNGGKMTLTDLLSTYYLEGIEKALAANRLMDDETRAFREFKRVLVKLDEGDFESLNTSIEWIIKRSLIDRWIDSLELEVDLDREAARVAALFQYSAVTDSLYDDLVECKGLKTVVSGKDVERAFYDPPEASRGELRTTLARCLKGKIKSLGWSSIKLLPTIQYYPYEFNALDGWTKKRIEEKTKEIKRRVLERTPLH